MAQIVVNITCRKCKDNYSITANYSDLQAWRAGALIQDALPYLSIDERELLISQTCNECFYEMFPDDDEPYCGDCLVPLSKCTHKGE